MGVYVCLGVTMKRKCERVAKESQGMNESGRGKESCVGESRLRRESGKEREGMKRRREREWN